MAVKFMKGKKAQKALKKADAEAKKREEEAKNKVWRFWLPKDEDNETPITFLDGDLDEDGMLDIPMIMEHQLHMNGSWQNWFPCIGEDDACPICEGGDTPYLVGFLTIIDHSEYKTKQGKVVKDQVKLFPAKRATIKQLQKLAKKRGGLTGCTFDVSRVGEQAASVGDVFDFVEQNTLKKILKKYEVDGPVDYSKVIIEYSRAELKEMGFGSLGVGGEEEPDEDDDPDVEDEL